MILDYRHWLGDQYYKRLYPVFKKADALILYHGTSDVFLEDILSNGIQPRKHTGNSVYLNKYGRCSGKIIESNPELVYVATFGWAFSSALRAVNKFKGNVIVFQILLNSKHLVADEDSKKQNYFSSLAWEGSCASTIPIPSSSFLGYYDQIKNYYNLNQLPNSIEISQDTKLHLFDDIKLKK